MLAPSVGTLPRMDPPPGRPTGGPSTPALTPRPEREVPARYPSRHAPVPPVLHHAPRRPQRGGDAVPPPAAAGRATCASWAPGIYSLLPLGFRVNQRVEQVIREELNAIGGQEMEMPVVHPADLWRETGRYDAIGPEMARFKDRADRDMVLAMTHEEVVADLLRDVVRSYRQLPIIVYHFQTKFRDEPRSRGGLIRVREFVMKDSVQLRSRRRRARRGVLGAPPRLHPDLRAPGPPGDPRQLRRRDDGRQPRPRVHGHSTRPARTSWSCARPATTRATARSPRRSPPSPTPRTSCPSRRSRRPTTTTIDSLATVPRRAHQPDGQGRVLRHRRRPVRRRDRPRRLRRQRDQARQRDQGDGGLPPGHGRRDQGARHGARLRLADRRPGRAWSWSTTSSRGAPTSSPGANKDGIGTCATSTCPATTRPTSPPTSATSARATPAPSAAGP